MCKIGDIILIKNYKDGETDLSRHSFIVLSDNSSEVMGLPYDIICNVMSSFSSEEQKQRKLSYPYNKEITLSDRTVPSGNDKEGYIKAEQFYYFNKSKTEYTVIGQMTVEAFNELIDFINDIPDEKIKHIIDNL